MNFIDMKALKTVFITLLLAISLQASAYVEFIGDKRSLVVAVMQDLKWKFIDSGHTRYNPDIRYISWETSAGSGYSVTFYFDKNDTCMGIREIVPRKQFLTIVNVLNKNYTRIDGYNWYSGNYNAKIQIKITDLLTIVDYRPIE